MYFLYAWQPNGHGELSWFVLAENESDAKQAVESEIMRRFSLPIGDNERITTSDFDGWGTDYYTLTVSDIGRVVSNDND